jgi:hypothetical protein
MGVAEPRYGRGYRVAAGKERSRPADPAVFAARAATLALRRLPRGKHHGAGPVVVAPTGEPAPAGDHLRSASVGGGAITRRKNAVVDNRIGWVWQPELRRTRMPYQAGIRAAGGHLPAMRRPVVRQEQYLFLSTWIAETDEALEDLPEAEKPPERFEFGATAQIFVTGPMTRDNAMSDMFVACMYAARQELTITTPYFVPDEAVHARSACGWCKMPSR